MSWLAGKKTYILAAVAAVDLFGSQLGWWAEDTLRSGLEGILMFVFMRLGVAKV